MNVKIYTDGSCRKNGVGGWGCILIFENRIEELSGVLKDTTNQRAELFAAIVSLEYLTEPHDIELYSDSAYLVNCFLQGWYKNWMRNGWLNSSGEPVANKDLWIRLMSSFTGHKIKFIKVKGHADDHYNNRCDELARQAGLSVQG